MLHIALYCPEIPPNTGNIIRLCANMAARLHIIEPMAFSLNEKACRRAGLDYHALTHVTCHANFDAFLSAITGRIFACSTKAQQNYCTPSYRPNDTLLFGPETRGLPTTIRAHPRVDAVVRIPMVEGSRSINLANAVAIVAFEAWRQNAFAPHT